MKRRSFIQTVPVAVGGMTVTAYGNNPLLSALTSSLTDTDRVLIIVQLNGGNDGLNMVIPLDQYSSLSKASIRQNVLLPEDKVLKLAGTNNATGLHPSMNRLYDLYENGKLSVIQGVGYPKFSYSHFRATDIWMTGAESTEYLNSGWAGRYLANEFPNYPVGFPNSVMPDPLAIRIGGNVVLGLQNQGVPMAISITNTNDPLNLTGSLFSDPPTSNYMGKELAYVREVQRQTDKFGDSVKGAADKGLNKSSLYPKTSADPGYTLGTQLAIIAKLISGGIKTRIFWVSTGGFDTHSAQVNANDHTIGTHANLLKGVSDAIGAFMDDVKLLGFEDRITGMTFSEFGRRIISNASGGTDHGAAQPMFVFGSKVVGGVVGKNPIIDPNSTANSNLPMQYDFRSVYASILADWFCVQQPDLDQILLKNYQKLPILDPGNCIPTSVHEENNRLGENLVYAYPNPFVQSTKIKFETKGGHTMIQIINNEGSVIKTLIDQDLQAGKYDVDCDLEDAAAGIYYVRIQNQTLQQVKPMMKVNG
ncbi:MAG: DUF1501 domain-containing protein [Saprospiraceae bacterium]|nr:DUF1501 domain-containing protein [Saprospiraceae bacterium]MBK8451344.1 DUF1501 domain-containing protein [Saprospiraceae bacterium]MBK9220813.1 DUF1501 domain-containing protein [Saprospiraceae bacterium]MBK9722342.1 DUF1501 domain-containing protein [Saprospiraceae bacterium]MBK9729366.1 DUF1501 domain-containing protein [Saprospiraceae bacterium]